MAQISTLPLVAGTEAPTTAPVGTAPELLGFTAEGQVVGFSFDETLKQLLESQGGDEAQAMLLFAMQQPVVTDPQLTPQALTSKDGNLLPLTFQADGKSLPEMLKPELMTLGAAPESNLPQPQFQTQLEARLKDPMLPSQMLTSLTSEQKPLPLNELVGRLEGRTLVDSLKSTDLNSPNQPASLSQSLVMDSSSAVKGAVTLPLNLPVGQPGWDQGLGERVQWMVNKNIQQAEIKLTPPNLGPLEIKISVQHDQTHVTFLAAQAPTREALEASIPRLREMFGEINLNLANVNVGQQQAGGSEQGGATHSPGYSGGEGVVSTSVQLSTERSGLSLSGRGLLDTYA
jgi:hypothetical protein